jgi:iron(III) transport system substrate-binding protein
MLNTIGLPRTGRARLRVRLPRPRAAARQHLHGAHGEHRRALIPEFEKATGIKADVVKAGSGDIINRCARNRRNPKADVIWSIGAELLEANSDLLQAYQPKEYAMIADAFKTTGPWLPYTGILNVFVVNTKKLKPEEYPKTWTELAQPRFKNLVSMADAENRAPRTCSSTRSSRSTATSRQAGTSSRTCYKNLNVSAASGAVPRFVNDGEAVVGITLEDNAYLY